MIKNKECKICNKSFEMKMKTEMYCPGCRDYKNVHKSNQNWLERVKKPKTKKGRSSNEIGYLFFKNNSTVKTNVYRG